MLQNFAGSSHPLFRCTSALERGDFRSKEGGKTSTHFNGTTENIELLLQMVISVNQLRLYGAVVDMIEELQVGHRAVEKLVASDQMEQEILTQPHLAEVQANKSDRETYCKITSEDLRDYQKTRSYPDYAPKQD